MRHVTSLILTTVVATWVASSFARAQDVLITIPSSSAGRAGTYEILGSGERRGKIRTSVKKPNGTVVQLPSVPVVIPTVPVDGPTIPPDAAGGTIIVELVDADTGETLSKCTAPIGY